MFPAPHVGSGTGDDVEFGGKYLAGNAGDNSKWTCLIFLTASSAEGAWAAEAVSNSDGRGPCEVCV